MTNNSAKFPIFNVEEIMRENMIIIIIIIIIIMIMIIIIITLNFALVCRPNVKLIL